MININLVRKENGNVSYEIQQYPDGQQTVDLDMDSLKSKSGNEASISSRLNSFRDIELIIATTAALRNEGITDINLCIPYFLGGRSDRKFLDGGVNYIKQVMAPIINSLQFKTVTVLHPHSDVIEACIDNIRIIKNDVLLYGALGTVDLDMSTTRFVSPDAGALKNVFSLNQWLGIPNEVLVANKIRDIKTGNIIRTEVPSYTDDMANDTMFIIDDICDGGRTFIEIVKALRERGYVGDIYLVVTHGIFSKGIPAVTSFFKKVFTTDSYQDMEESDVLSVMKVY